MEFFSEHHRRIDLVLLDLVMPRLAGDDAFVRMHAIDADVPILIASAFTKPGVIERLLSAGVVGFLSKPYGINDISTAIAKHLAERRRSDLARDCISD